MAGLELFANQASTTVSSGGTTAPSPGTSETWTVASSTGFPAASSTASPPTFFRVTDPASSTEKMLVTNVSGTTWTVTRGAEGTTPVSHAGGFIVQNVLTAGGIATLQASSAPAMRLIYLDDYGADPTGAAASDSAWSTAYTAAVAAIAVYGADTGITTGVQVVLGAGIYKFSTGTVAISDARIGLTGQGSAVTFIVPNDFSTGNLVSVGVSGSEPGGTSAAAVGGFSLDGWDGGSGLIGLKLSGERDRMYVHDIIATGFTASSGFWFLPGNSGGFEGGAFFNLEAQNCLTGYLFDGNSTTPGGSVDYTWWKLHAVACQQPLRFINNVHAYGATIQLGGNMGGGTLTGAATVVTVGASTSDNARLQNSHLFWMMEADSGPSSVTDLVIKGTTNTGIISCFGLIGFINAGSTVIAGSLSGSATFSFQGVLENVPLAVSMPGAKYQTGVQLSAVNSVASGGVPLLNVIAYGADPTGTNDSTSAIQAALLAFGTLGSWSQGQGGIVYVPPGIYKTTKTLVIPSGVTLQGSGWGSQISLATNSGCDMIQTATYQSSSQATVLGVSTSAIANGFWCGVRDIALHGDAFTATTPAYFHGINVTTSPLSSSATGDPDFDPSPTIENVWIKACTGDGYYHNGRSGAFLKRVWAESCNGNGFTMSTDSTLVDCLGAYCSTGFYLNHSSNMATGCKAFNNFDSTWTSGFSYVPGYPAVYSGSLYWCTVAVSGSTPPPSDSSHWTLVSAATSPAATGYGYYWDTNSSEHTWAACDGQDNSKGDFYFHGPLSGAVTVHGSSSTVNFNNGQPAYNAANPNHNAAVTLDGCSGVLVTLNSSKQSAGAGVICTSLNSPGSNTFIAVTDGTETSVFQGGTPGFSLVNGALTLLPGTTSAPPLTLRSGTLETTAAAGAVEFDGTAFYASAASASRQVIDAEQMAALTTTYTLSSTTALQKLLNASSTGALTVQASTTYFFECEFDISSMATASGGLSFGFGGTAGFTSLKYMAFTQKSATALTTPTTPQFVVGTAAAATPLVASTATTGLNTALSRVKGVVRISTGGTIIPEIALGVATSTAVVGTNSFFRIWPQGSNTVTSVGDWS